MIEQKLVQESGAKPAGCIIQTDYTIDIQGGFLIIPWTGMLFLKELPCTKFSKKDTYCVDASTKEQWFSFEQFGDGLYKNCHSINGKHPKGGITFQPNVMISHGCCGREQYLKAPPEKATR